jgi:glucose/arabinose dehydrogenase
MRNAARHESISGRFSLSLARRAPESRTGFSLRTSLSRVAAIAVVSLGLAIPSLAHHAEGFIDSDLDRPDGGPWQEAVGITFDGSGRTWVWERGGRVWIIDDDNPVTTPFLDISHEVGAWHDHGMLGFALHPNFNENGYVYLLYLVDRHHLVNCNEPAAGVGVPVCTGYSTTTNDYFSATIGRLTRYQAVLPSGHTDYSKATAFNPASRTVLIGRTKSTGVISTSRSHVTGSLVFGSDGTLLLTTGDGARAAADSGSGSTAGDDLSYTAQALADGILDAAQDVGANRAQMIDSLNGKILRIDPITGAGIPGNPYYNSAAPNSPRSKVFGMGLRNPYRFSLWPDTGSHDRADGDPGTLIIGDVGRNAWEEINLMEEAGQNFGWPIYEGMNLFPSSSFAFGRVDNVYAPNPRFGIGGCSEQYFQFDDLLVQETLNTPSFPNPCNATVQINPQTPTHMHTRPILAWAHQSAVTKSKGFNGSGNAVDFDINNPHTPIQGPQFTGKTATAARI